MTLEKEIEQVKQKHAQLELESSKQALLNKYEELKKLEGTVQVQIMKTSKTTRHVYLVYHVSYEMSKDKWDNKDCINTHTKHVTICDFPKLPYRKYSIETSEIVPGGYNGIIKLGTVKEENNRYSFSTYKNISIEDFEAIWNLAKITCHNILDGILDIKDVQWVMNGTDEDREFDIRELKEDNILIDLKHIILTREESWHLQNKYCSAFLNKNIYFITPNSLKALDSWYADQRKFDSFASSACASVGERWRGSRIDEYNSLIKKIKSA